MKRRIVIVVFVILLLLGGAFSSGCEISNDEKVRNKEPTCFFGLINMRSILHVRWEGTSHIPINDISYVNTTITHTITRGLFGKNILRILEGFPIEIEILINKTSEWITANITPNTLTIPVKQEQLQEKNVTLSIYIDGNTPPQSAGFIQLKVIANPLKLFGIFTIINDYQQVFTMSVLAIPSS